MISGNYQGQHAMGHTTNFYSSSQHDSPLVLSDPNLELANNGHESLWNGVMKPDEGTVQMTHLQPPVHPEQGMFTTEGQGVEYLTFDEVYSDGLSLKDIGAAGADVEPFWQVCASFVIDAKILSCCKVNSCSHMVILPHIVR